jgi:histone-lysine N-methyltransferase SETMAR
MRIRPRKSQKTKDEITKLGWTTLPHHPHSPDVAPSDCHLFGKLKEPFHRTKFDDDDAIITATKQWLRRTGPEIYRAGIQALVPRWHKAVERDGDCVEK